MSNTNTNLPTQTSSVLHNDTVSSCSTSTVQEKTQLSKERCIKSLRAFQHKKIIQIQFHALNVDSLKVDLVVIQNTCSENEDSNSKTASNKLVNESSLDSATKDVHAIKYKMSKSKERCMVYFQSLHSHLQVLSKEDLKGTRIEHGFKWAFMSLFGQDVDTFTSTILLNIDQLQKSGNDTDADDADIIPIYDEEPMAEVQLTIECNIFAIGQQHTEQPEIINEGKVDQYPEQCQVKNPMLDSSPDNQTTEYSKQSLESKTIEQTTSLLDNNADLKAQIQENVFAIAALKNELRKLKGNSVDTKPQMSKQRFASQVDVSNNLSRPVTQHYLPKRRESISTKPDHMIASSESRDSSKNMPRFSSNDMVHDHYLDEARKKTQERDRNSKTNVIHSARFQSTIDGSKPKPRSTNHSTRSLPVSKSSCVTITAVPKTDQSKISSSFSDSKHFVCSTCHKCIFNANHDACITKLLKEVNSHAKIQSHKTRNSNKPVDQKSHTQKPGRHIFIRHRFSPNKTSAVYEKTSPRSDLRWKPTGRILKSVGLTWIPIGKLFDSCTSKVDSTSIDVQKEQSIDLSASTLCNVNKENLRVWLLKKLIYQKPVLK
ncbi:hypothetical protein Tco_0999383 [Tanacetum coccineum]